MIVGRILQPTATRPDGDADRDRGPAADARDGRRTRGPRPGAPVRSNQNTVIRIE